MTKTVKQIGEIGGEPDQAQHSPEPWRYVDDSTPADKEMGLGQYCIETADGAFDVASLLHSEADARRICAAVNACRGISTEALEQGIIGDLRQALQDLLWPWDDDQLRKRAEAKSRAALAKATRKTP